MQTRYLFLLRIALPIIDMVILNAVYLFTYHYAFGLNQNIYSEGENHYLLVCNLLWLINSYLFKLYTISVTRAIEMIYRATWKTIVFHGVIFTVYFFFSKDSQLWRYFVPLFYTMLAVAFMFNRFFGTLFQYILYKRFKISKKVAIIGNNYTAARLKHFLKSQKNVSFHGFIGVNVPIFNKEGAVSKEMAAELSYIADLGVKDVYVCIPPDELKMFASFRKEAEDNLIRLKFVPDMGGIAVAPYSMSYIGGEFPVITLRNEPLEAIHNRFKKRAFDFVFSIAVVIFVLSWLYPIISILIKLQSPGPILFKQIRSGRNDAPFSCYKFRSMYMNNDSDAKQATKGDSRVTPIGKFIRRTSIDELPQFFNVLKGEMSVVGPRPHMLKHTEEYRALIDKFMVRHFLKPGITGWAQVNGLRGETKTTEDMQRRIEHDIEYVEKWSLMWDIRIVFLTIFNAVRGEDNAY